MTADALIAAQLCAVDPGLGGMILRGDAFRAEDVDRDAVLATLTAALPNAAPFRKMPVHIDDERLLGGLDLAATLASDRPVARRGLLADAHGGVVVIPMAERIEARIASQIAAVLDTREVVAERDGMSQRDPADLVFVLFDDGVEDERVADVLAERLAFHVDLSHPGSGDADMPARAIRPDPADVTIDGAALRAIAHAASALGVMSARASLFTVRAAKAAARLGGRDDVHDDDVILAIRLVLVPRATQFPANDDAADDTPDDRPETSDPGEQSAGDASRPLEDVILDAVKATLPPDIIAAIAENGRRTAQSKGRGSGAKLKAQLRGRPVGVRAGIPRGGNRLSLIETLRAAAPWQKLRRAPGDRRVRIRRDDLRIKRFQSRAETTTIFVVDASGSSAAARLAEAKGAVELLLAQAYVKRAQVALIAFRGIGAELLLPPTRSLTRARRALAELPGGGGTPLAAGLSAAYDVAMAVKAKDRTPFLVILTDGRGNIAADGSADAAKARDDALVAARSLAGVTGVLIDISARPRDDGRAVAAAMGARFIALPRGDAGAMRDVVNAA